MESSLERSSGVALGSALERVPEVASEGAREGEVGQGKRARQEGKAREGEVVSERARQEGVTGE